MDYPAGINLSWRFKQAAGMVNMFAWVRKSGDLLLFFRYFLFLNGDLQIRRSCVFPDWLMHLIHNLGIPCSKPLSSSNLHLAFHPCEVNQISSRNFWQLAGKK